MNNIQYLKSRLKFKVLLMIIFLGLSSLTISVQPTNAKEQFDLTTSYYSKGALKQAVNWYRKAAEQGHAQAQYKLGVRYSNGQEVVKTIMNNLLFVQL